MMKIGSLAQVQAVDENKVMTTLRKGYNKVGDIVEKGGKILGAAGGALTGATYGQLPLIGRAYRGAMEGGKKGFKYVDDAANKHIWKPISKAVGARDGEKDDKKDKK